MASYLPFGRMVIFSAPASGFVGFRFNTGKGTQYGWARIQTRDINDHTRDVIRDYAWGDVGDVILTGQTHSLQPANANSVVGSLGLLAFGAQGLDAWRIKARRTPTDQGTGSRRPVSSITRLP